MKYMFTRTLNIIQRLHILGNIYLTRQIDHCPMGGPTSIALSNIFCIKIDQDQVSPLNPNHTSVTSVTFLVKVKPDKIYKLHNTYSTCQKIIKNNNSWSLAIPKTYDRNKMLEDSHSDKQISSIQNLTLHTKKRNTHASNFYLT